MHELGIALNIMEIAQESLPPEMPRAAIKRINVRAGRLSGVVADSLRFCFEAARRDTRFEETELVIEEIPVTVQCDGCHRTWQAEEPVFRCAECGGGSVSILTGRELEIVSIEVEEATLTRGEPGAPT
jgi:hydrogenase nickel incorporation protein HypA/HybF